MRWNDVRVESCAVRLGRLVPVQAAVAEGGYDARTQAAHGYHSVSDAGEATAVDLAADAVDAAVKRSGLDVDDVAMLVYACCGAPPTGILTPASEVQSRSIPTSASAVEVRQGCNSGLAALELAAGYLRAADEDSVVVVVAADRFQAGADRYQDDPGCVPGDGAAALILSRRRGFARLLSTTIVGDGRLEKTPVVRLPAGTDRRTFIKEQRKRLLPILRARAELEESGMRRALEEAGLTAGAIDRWVFANIGEYMVNRRLRDAFGVKDEDTTWSWGRTVGHLDSGDQIAGLAHVLETAAVRPGGHVAMVGNGVGVSYGCAVVRVEADPPWSVPSDDGIRSVPTETGR